MWGLANGQGCFPWWESENCRLKVLQKSKRAFLLFVFLFLLLFLPPTQMMMTSWLPEHVLPGRRIQAEGHAHTALLHAGAALGALRVKATLPLTLNWH